MLADPAGILVDSSEQMPPTWHDTLRSSVRSQMHLWAGEVAPIGEALGLDPRAALISEAFGDAADGDIDAAMKMGFVVLFSSLFKLA